MVYKIFPETMSLGNKLINKLFHDRSINKADRIWAISHYTKSEVENTFPRRLCKQIFVGGGIDKDLFFKKDISFDEKYSVIKKTNPGDKFLLFVGTLEPRKNLLFLLSLMPRLAFEGFTLLIVGSKGWGKNELEVINQINYPKEYIKFAGYVSTNELIILYHLANVYISTSLNEGFGLPQLEAMSCGCPVVCPHNSAMIEVVEGAGETVKGWDKEEWLKKILQLSKNRNYYIERGLIRSSQYSWAVSVEHLLNYMK